MGFKWLLSQLALLAGYETQTYNGMLSSKTDQKNNQIEAIATLLIVFGTHVEHVVQSLSKICLHDVRS